MNLTTITPPGGEPLTIADAKLFARVSGDHDDTLIGQLIAAARARIEAETGLALMSRTLRLRLDEWPLGVLERGTLCLPNGPAVSLSAVRITDGVDSIDVTANFQLEPGLYGFLKPVPFGGWTWPQSIHEWIEIDWVAGFGAAEDVPEDLLQAIRIVVAHGYEHRDASDWRAQDALADRLNEILSPWREVRI